MIASPPSGTSRRWSLFNRIVALYVASATVLLAVCLGTLYALIVRQIEEEDRQFLREQIGLLQVLLSELPDSQRILAKLHQGRPSLGSLRFFVRVLNEGGATIAESPHMVDLLPPDLFPSGEISAPLAFASRDAKHGRFLLVSTWAARNESGQRFLLEVALDQSGDDALAGEFRRQMGLVLLGGVLMAGGLSAWVSRRALRPVQLLADATQRVTAKQLHARMSTVGWPVELASLASGFGTMLARLDDSFQRLSEFSANLSHELRTPINNLLSEGEVALSRVRSADEYRAVIESSLEELQRLTRLIDNLLFLARAESAEIRLDREELDAVDELRSVADFYGALAEEQGVTVTLHGEARLRSDSMLVRRMVSNLLANALRHTPAGGRVELGALATTDGGVELFVTDTGEGIASEHLPRVFDRFYRGKLNEREAAKGFGLGLPIVRSIMRLHGGEVRLESALGRGTKVILSFPGQRLAGAN